MKVVAEVISQNGLVKKQNPTCLSLANGPMYLNVQRERTQVSEWGTGHIMYLNVQGNEGKCPNEPVLQKKQKQKDKKWDMQAEGEA